MFIKITMKNQHMKNIILIILFAFCITNIKAQNTSIKKQPSIGLHLFYNDFATPSLIQATSFGNVLRNKTWNKPQNMEGGFGLDYLQGFTDKIDLIGTVNASWVNYLLPNSLLYGSSNFLMDINAGAHIKLLTDKHVINPFLITKIGYSAYKNINGFSLIPGLGIQANLFNEAFILTTVEYRAALNNSLSNQIYYSIGIATNITKKKLNTPKQIVEKPIIKEPEPIVKKEPEEIKIPAKNITVTVTDEATGQPLQYVAVTIKSNDGNIFNATTNADGKAMFNNIKADGYLINGRLNKIDATTATIIKDDFNKAENQIAINIMHNDPRFTLVGNTVDKTADKPVGDTKISITNSTQSSTAFATSTLPDGEFRTQLEAASDFVIVGKKASYISNIESLSTKGLNRSATLYVKLQLGIEEAKAGKSITLKNIYYDLGKTEIRASASSDIDRLLQFLNDNPLIKIEIASHTDSRGSDATNLKLSQSRAQAVADYLIKKGIAKERLQPKGYGETQLTNACGNGVKCTEAQHQQNRRTEFKVVGD